MNFFVDRNRINGNKIVINGSDVNHIKNVLRKKQGDVISIVSDGEMFKSKIVSLSTECIECEVIEHSCMENSGLKITIFQGLAKADKIEYIIQKCTELGVHEIIPTEMKRCVVKLDGKDKVKKIDRWKKIAEVASKQCLRSDILRVDRILSLNQAMEIFHEYDCVIVAYEKEISNTLKCVVEKIESPNSNIAVVIGPEGGIDDEEFDNLIQNGAISVSLGKRILRTETVGIVVCSILNYEFER